MHTTTPCRISALLCLCLLFFAGGVSPVAARQSGNELTLYTAITATTPQVPLLAAVAQGWPQGHALRVEYWKTLDDLRALTLAGKGHVWVGNLDSFALAALRGAPITLVAVTGWKKFYFLAPEGMPAASLADLATALRTNGETLALAPPDSPAIGILEAIARHGGPAFAVTPLSPQQLMLEAMRGTRRAILLPEPLVSTLLAKIPGLHVVASLEEEYARLVGGPARLPIAGVAVHTALAATNPALVHALMGGMQAQSQRFAADPAAALPLLPNSVAAAVGREALAASLGRDMILALPANAVREEIRTFLDMVLNPAGDAGTAARLDTLLASPFIAPGDL